MLGRMKPWSYLVGPAGAYHANVERPVISTAWLRSGISGGSDGDGHANVNVSGNSQHLKRSPSFALTMVHRLTERYGPWGPGVAGRQRWAARSPATVRRSVAVATTRSAATSRARGDRADASDTVALGGFEAARRHEHGTDLVAVKAGGVGLVVQPRSAHVSRRRDGDETLLLGVAIETRHCAQPSRCGVLQAAGHDVLEITLTVPDTNALMAAPGVPIPTSTR